VAHPDHAPLNRAMTELTNQLQNMQNRPQKMLGQSNCVAVAKIETLDRKAGELGHKVDRGLLKV